MNYNTEAILGLLGFFSLYSTILVLLWMSYWKRGENKKKRK